MGTSAPFRPKTFLHSGESPVGDQQAWGWGQDSSKAGRNGEERIRASAEVPVVTGLMKG